MGNNLMPTPRLQFSLFESRSAMSVKQRSYPAHIAFVEMADQQRTKIDGPVLTAWMPSRSHHTLKRASSPAPFEPNGPPLSTRMTSGRSARWNSRRVCVCTGRQRWSGDGRTSEPCRLNKFNCYPRVDSVP